MPAAFSPGELRHVTASLSLSFLICQMGLSVPSLQGQSRAHGRGSEHCLLPHPVPQTVPGHIFLQLIPPRAPLCHEGGRKEAGAKLDLHLDKRRCLCGSEILPGLTERQGPSKFPTFLT